MTDSKHSERNTCPLVSVVTPAYNAMPFIVDTIKSVQTQDYPAVEHIIIDGGSKDGTREVLEQYPHLKWLSETDRGQSEALNKGFRMAQGEIIGWLNADDTYLPGAISQAAAYFRMHPEADLVYSDVQVIDENGRPIRIAKGEPFSLETLLKFNIIKQPTVFLRKKVLSASGGVNEDLHFVMDHEFWLRAAKNFNIQYIPDVIFANFRFCKGTKSHEKPLEFQKEWIEVLDNFANISGGDKVLLEKINLARQFTARQYSFGLMVQASNDANYKDVISSFYMAIKCDWRSLFQIGVWKLFFRVIFRRTGTNP